MADAYISDGGLPGAPLVRAQQFFAIAELGSILENESPVCFHDFRPLIDPMYPITYTMGLVTPEGNVEVPISSWQATLQTDSSCYASCVVPNCAEWLETIYTATEFIIYRNSKTIAGEAFRHQMVRGELVYQIDQGSTNHTCSLSSYFDAYPDAGENPDARCDSTLVGLRSVSRYASGLRIRTAIDWLAQPRYRAHYDDGDESMIVSFINYYANNSDEYMDVGHREPEA